MNDREDFTNNPLVCSEKEKNESEIVWKEWKINKEDCLFEIKEG